MSVDIEIRNKRAENYCLKLYVRGASVFLNLEKKYVEVMIHG